LDQKLQLLKFIVESAVKLLSSLKTFCVRHKFCSPHKFTVWYNQHTWKVSIPNQKVQKTWNKKWGTWQFRKC